MPELKGKGLFVFSDPGGAKPILALNKCLKPASAVYKIISDRSYSFFDNFEIEVSQPVLSALEELKIYQPDFIFTGTSYTSSFELEFLKAAKELSIPTYSFVDHWTSIRERFNNKGVEIFPDFILVIDERAKEIAITQGIEKKKLLVVGNPYHQYLKQWEPIISKEKFLQSMGLQNIKKKIVLYAPDPLSNIEGLSTYGFDEIIATKQLIESMKILKGAYTFFCQLHPNQHPGLLVPLLKDEMVVPPAGTDVNTLIYYSDVVIGFFSNLLLEAIVLKKPVLRFFIRKGLIDPFENMGVGKIVYPETIVRELKMIL